MAALVGPLSPQQPTSCAACGRRAYPSARPPRCMCCSSSSPAYLEAVHRRAPASKAPWTLSRQGVPWPRLAPLHAATCGEVKSAPGRNASARARRRSGKDARQRAGFARLPQRARTHGRRKSARRRRRRSRRSFATKAKTRRTVNLPAATVRRPPHRHRHRRRHRRRSARRCRRRHSQRLRPRRRRSYSR